jgi:hypothetical protein
VRSRVSAAGSLAVQGRDELYRRFHLPFEFPTNDKLEAEGAATGSWRRTWSSLASDKFSLTEDVQAIYSPGLWRGSDRLR